MGEETTEFGEL